MYQVASRQRYKFGSSLIVKKVTKQIKQMPKYCLRVNFCAHNKHSFAFKQKPQKEQPNKKRFRSL